MADSQAIGLWGLVAMGVTFLAIEKFRPKPSVDTLSQTTTLIHALANSLPLMMAVLWWACTFKLVPEPYLVSLRLISGKSVSTC